MEAETLTHRDWKDIADRTMAFLDAHDDFVVCGHPYPDGDSIGCVAAICEVLQAKGKTTHAVLFAPLPHRFSFLNGSRTMQVFPDRLPENPGALICLDIGSRKRITNLLDALPDGIPILNIDHHVSNTEFGTLNFTTDAVSSVGEILYNIFRARAIALTPTLAEALYVAIITDTGRLCYRNTRPATLDACAHLMRNGVDCARVFRHLFEDSSPQRLQLLSRALTTLGTSDDDRVSWMLVRREMYEQTGTNFEDTYEFIDIVKSVTGTKVALLFRDADSSGVKISVRSDGSISAHDLCNHFGGGGHRCAAGAVMDDTMDSSRDRFLQTLTAMFRDAGL